MDALSFRPTLHPAEVHDADVSTNSDPFTEVRLDSAPEPPLAASTRDSLCSVNAGRLPLPLCLLPRRRSHARLESPPGPIVQVDGAEYLYFGGTGYLGLQADREVLEAAVGAVRRYGVHTGTSRTRLDSPSVLAAERAATEYFAAEDAILTPTGYVCAAMLLASPDSQFDTILLDEHAHYCLADAARATGYPRSRFAHGDANDLERKLAALPPGSHPLVMTDGVFASTGEVPPLDRYVELLDRHSACEGAATLLVDDAHGAGCVGPEGRGVLDHFGLLGRGNQPTQPNAAALLWCTTASKALGGHGGLIVGSRSVLDALRTTSWFAGTSAPANAVAASTAAAILKTHRQPELRQRLAERVKHLHAGLERLGLAPPPSNRTCATPIFALTIGTAARMLTIHEQLRANGILVPYARRYSGVGPEGSLRVAVFANHESAMIDRLLDTLEQVVAATA